MEVLVIRKTDRTEINEAIRDREIRVVGDDGEQLGIMSARDAYKIALEKKLDLVKIAPQAKPPVCKIMDYGKHRYEQQKRDKEAKKKQKQVSLKEIRLSVNIEKHDIETKAKRAIKFLEDGDKLKISLRLRGRELGNTSAAVEVMNKFIELLSEVGTVDKRPKMEGRSVISYLTPKNV